MSTYTDASLIYYPSGYKASKAYSLKPTDGSGDLTFTRASSATRVNADGLIEKVRTNLILQSETFDNAYWSKPSGSSVTANSVANPIDGAITADTLTVVTTQYSGLYGAGTGSGNFTQSIYAKKNTIDFLYIFNPEGTIIAAWFNLANGTLGQVTVGYSANIESVGNGWYRCSIRNTSTQANNYFQIGLSSTDGSNTPSAAGSAYIFGAQSELSALATKYIPTTTTAVSVGMLANVPRIDYTGGGCAKLLLEPQRTNIALRSEEFSNASSWALTNSGTITANTTISPDGTQTADTLNAGANSAQVQQAPTGTSGAVYTVSIWVKRITGTGNVFLRAVENADTLIEVTSDWQRFTATVTSTSTLIRVGVKLATSGDAVAIWGAQLELGSYPTSYIPTTTTAVTRVADGASKSGISSLIGQTECVIYFEFTKDVFDFGSNFSYFQIGAFPAYIGIYLQGSNIIGEVRNSGGQAFITKTSLSIGRHKAALAYKTNDFAFYVDGILIGTDNSGSVPTTSTMDLNASANGIQIYFQAAMIFKTRLSNAELATLTTI